MVAVCAVACVSADPAFEAAARQGPVVSATIQTIDDQLRTGRFVEAERSARQTIAAIEARADKVIRSTWRMRSTV